MKKILLATLCFVCLFSASVRAEVLHVYNWSEYIPQELLDQFTEETGIEVVYATYDSNEAMYAKLKLLEGRGYDIVVPSSYFVELMRDNGLLSIIDKSKIPNLQFLDEDIANKAFDSEDTYSIPYMWGAQGFMVNQNVVDPATITSWNDLNRPEFVGSLLLSDDLRDTFGLALMATGSSVNSHDPEEIQAAYEWLEALKPSVRIFDVTAAKQALISEEVAAGTIWNGDAYIVEQENPNLVFIYPEEGLPLWMDSFVIPAQAENPEAAYAFINFMLAPENIAKAMEEYNYSSAIEGVSEFLPEELRQSELLFPSDAVMENSEFVRGIGETQAIYEEHWENLKIGD